MASSVTGTDGLQDELKLKGARGTQFAPENKNPPLNYIVLEVFWTEVDDASNGTVVLIQLAVGGVGDNLLLEKGDDKVEHFS